MFRMADNFTVVVVKLVNYEFSIFNVFFRILYFILKVIIEK